MQDIRMMVESKTPNVKRFNDSIMVKSKPDVPPVAVCEKHGSFEFKYISSFSDQFICSSSCSKCITERDEYIDSEVIRIESERKENAISSLIINRGVSKRNLYKTFDTFVAETQEQKKSKSLYEEFASSVCNGSTAKNLIVCGSVGTGKTHLASSVINKITRNGKKCELIKIIDLIREFKSTWSKESDSTEQNFLDYYCSIDALIIDEVGVQFGSDTEKMVVFDIIDGRYNNMLPTVLISNLALPDVQELVGERAIDRLREDGGVVVAMKWKSHRGVK